MDVKYEKLLEGMEKGRGTYRC